MTHSPGPWRWEGDPRCALVAADGKVVLSIYNTSLPQDPVTWDEALGSNHTDDAVAQANARLMMLAPELLEIATAILAGIPFPQDQNIERLRDLVARARQEGCP